MLCGATLNPCSTGSWGSIMANLTISVDEAVLKRARIKALQEGESVNALVRDFLIRYAGLDSQAQQATKGLLALARRSEARRGGARWTRDELHER